MSKPEIVLLIASLILAGALIIQSTQVSYWRDKYHDLADRYSGLLAARRRDDDERGR